MSTPSAKQKMRAEAYARAVVAMASDRLKVRATLEKKAKKAAMEGRSVSFEKFFHPGSVL